MDTIAKKIFLIIACLFFIGFLLILFTHRYRDVTTEMKREMWIKYFSYFLIVNIFLLSVFSAPLLFYALILFIIFIGSMEFFKMLAFKGINAYRGLGIIAAMGIFAAAVFKDAKAVYFSAFLSFIPVLVISIVQRKAESSTGKTSSTILGIFYASLLPVHIILIYKLKDGIYYVAFLYLLLIMNDGFSQLFGRLMGRRKIWPNISPNKTFAGSIGGLLSTVAGSMVFRFILPTMPLYYCITGGALIGISGQMGDLIASAFKRDSNIKDFGAILPGQGGILDRFDSLIFTAPVFYYYLILIS